MAGDRALQGGRELAKKLDELGKQAQGKALRAAVRAAMQPALKAARESIPVGEIEHKTYKGRLVAPGFAKRSLKVVARLDRTGQKAAAVLGVKNEAFYAVNFLELGTAKMPARPWLRPAFERTIDAQIDAFAKAARKQIEKLARQK